MRKSTQKAPASVTLPPKQELKNVVVQPENVDLTVEFRQRLDHLVRRCRQLITDKDLQRELHVPMAEAEKLLALGIHYRRGFRDGVMIDRLPKPRPTMSTA